MHRNPSPNAVLQPIAGTIFWNETTTPLTGSATFTGGSRDLGVAANNHSSYSFFNAFFIADQTGTASIEGSNDGSTWYTVTTSSLSINTPLTLSAPVMTQYHRAKLVNGASGQSSLKINTAYTAT